MPAAMEDCQYPNLFASNHVVDPVKLGSDEAARDARPRIGLGNTERTRLASRQRDLLRPSILRPNRAGVPHIRLRRRARPVQRAEAF